MATKKDLQNYVAYLNDKYCKNSKNHFEIHQAYGGYSVGLTGKTYKRGGKTHYYKNSLRSGMADVGNPYHDTATKTLEGLYRAEARGWIKEKVKHYNKNSF